MGLVYPPLPILHQIEKAMYNKFRESHPSMCYSDKCKLAKMFCQASNGTTIFPKLVSMIDQYEKIWRRSNEVKLAKEEMNEASSMT